MKATMLRIFGLLSAAVAVLALLLTPLGYYPNGHDALAYDGLLLMLLIASLAIIVGAKLLREQHPSAEKIFPSTLVAYGLVVLMFSYWLNSPH